jgi:hypothetical protein
MLEIHLRYYFLEIVNVIEDHTVTMPLKIVMSLKVISAMMFLKIVDFARLSVLF